MDADFLSGLLLFAVVLIGAGYLVKTFFWESWVALVSTRQKPPPPGTNDHLIGTVGRVVDDGARTGEMRVRVGMETWRARIDTSAAMLPIGAQVEVKAVVDARMLEVAELRKDGEADGNDA